MFTGMLRQRLDAALAAEAEAGAGDVRHVEASVPQRRAEAQPFNQLPHILSDICFSSDSGMFISSIMQPFAKSANPLS